MNTNTRYRVKIRTENSRKFNFVASNGYTTSKVVKALSWPEKMEAVELANRLLFANECVSAVRVVDGTGKLVFRAGMATPPKVEFPFFEYSYLRSIYNNRGTFEVKDEDGRWGTVTDEIYSFCHAEAKRAGIRTDSFSIRGSICLIQTKGLIFNQQTNPWIESQNVDA